MTQQWGNMAKKLVSIFLDKEQIERLDKLSAKTRVPKAVYAREGIDLATVKELLGHKTISMTMSYALLAPSHKVRAVDALDETLNDRSTAQLLHNRKVTSNVATCNPLISLEPASGVEPPTC